MTGDATAVQLEEIAQIAVTVPNLEEAKAFYRDALGMKFLFDAGTMAFFQCGTVRLLLGQGEQAAGGTILYYRVQNIEVAHAALESKGVVFVQGPHLTARMKSHDLWLAFFRDPAGNTLALMEEKVRSV